MYASYFGLSELPFNVTPDPRFLYVNECYQEAIAALRYGIEARKGFIALVGEAGTGKTTMLRRLLDQLDPSCRTVLLMHPTVSFDEILEHILMELGIPVDGAKKLTQLQRLNEFLIEHTLAGGNVALLIDEAQDLETSVMEELRLLSNLETGSEKILQIVLAGQPELDERLADGSLRQLRQRITLQIRLRQLQEQEVSAYVHARLAQVGGDAGKVFEPEALKRIAAVSSGIPRVVNVVCDAAMLQAFATGSARITPKIVDEAWADYSRGYQAMSGDPLVPARAAQIASEPEPDGGKASAPVMVAEAPPVAPVAPVVAAPAEPAASPPPVPSDALAESPAVATVSEPPADAPAPLESAPPPEEVAPLRPAAAGTVAQAVERAGSQIAPDAAPAPAVEAKPARGAGGMVRLLVAGAVLVVVGVSIAGLLRQPAEVPPPVTTHATTPPTTAAPIAEAPTPPSTVEVATATTTLPAVAEAPSTTLPAPPPAPVAEPLPPADARALIEAFRAAYEARDTEAIAALLAPDVQHNDLVGRVSMIDEYDAAFSDMRNVAYRLPALQVTVRDQQTVVSSPFVITYRQADGKRKEMRGSAEWQVERRDGRPMIAGLKYRVES